MTDRFQLESGRLPGLAGIHDDVVTALGQVTGTAPETLGVETSHGPIASGVYGALGTALPSRLSTLQATSTSSATISDLLRKADQLLAGGDQQGAEKLRAAAEALENSEGGGPVTGAGPSGAATGTGAAGTGGGAEQAGQMAGQVGQQAGQLAGSMVQAMQGLAQGLAQLPQQVMQGVQGIVESAAKSTDSAEAKADHEKDADEKSTADEEHEDEQHHAPTVPTEGARPGGGADGSRAPEPPAAAPPPPPAQTRPQQSVL